MDIHGYPWILVQYENWYGGSRVGRGGVARAWVEAEWVAAGGGDPPATHPDGNNGNNGNDGNGNNGNNGNGNEAVGARYAPNQRAQGSHMPFGAPLSANPPHSDLSVPKCCRSVPQCYRSIPTCFGSVPKCYRSVPSVADPSKVLGVRPKCFNIIIIRVRGVGA